MGTKVRARRWHDTQDQPGVNAIQFSQLFFLSSLPDAASLEVWMAYGLLGKETEQPGKSLDVEIWATDGVF